MVQVPITEAQRARLTALRGQGLALSNVYRRALNIVLEMHAGEDDFGPLEQIADRIEAGAQPSSALEKQLAHGFRRALLQARVERERADTAVTQWTELRARMREWGDSIATELRRRCHG